MELLAAAVVVILQPYCMHLINPRRMCERGLQ